jgi:hypothetical protein
MHRKWGGFGRNDVLEASYSFASILLCRALQLYALQDYEQFQFYEICKASAYT